ncbi:MAG: Gfo/Idh/MocA family oxidoreductase, partial [Candidatus Eremiobacteraeota bacterium]|nr:Gfo/Idh/MocA family oxidoreductase [Candidatus Eremiobacteraeota bacterium]
MAAKIRVGIVGSGFGGIVHAPALAAHDRFELVAIASPNRAGEIARQRKIPHAFDSVEAMLDGVALDAVTISPPPFAHRDAAVSALARGKHVLCEKPLARTVAEGEEIVAAARRAQTACGIAFEFRFTSAWQALKELVVNGHLGALREIESTTLDAFLRADQTRRRRGWWFEKARGGGLAQAFGSHLIDSVNWLAGRYPQRILGLGRVANPRRRDEEGAFVSDVADGVFALLDYGDGLVGRITLDGTTAQQSSTLAVHGERLSAVAAGDTIIDATLFTVDEEESSELTIAASPYSSYAAAHPNLPPFLSLLDEWAKAIDG